MTTGKQPARPASPTSPTSKGSAIVVPAPGTSPASPASSPPDTVPRSEMEKNIAALQSSMQAKINERDKTVAELTKRFADIEGRMAEVQAEKEWLGLDPTVADQAKGLFTRQQAVSQRERQLQEREATLAKLQTELTEQYKPFMAQKVAMDFKVPVEALEGLDSYEAMRTVAERVHRFGQPYAGQPASTPGPDTGPGGAPTGVDASSLSPVEKVRLGLKLRGG